MDLMTAGGSWAWACTGAAGAGADDRGRQAAGDGADREQPGGVTRGDREGGRLPAGGAEGGPRVVLGRTRWRGGCGGHLAHPLGVKAFSYRRARNDEKDAGDVADLLRMGRLPEAWIAPGGDPRATGVN